LEIWQEKLDYFQQQEAIASEPEQKFSLKKLIEEAKRKIREIGDGLTAPSQQDAVAGKVPSPFVVVSADVQPAPIRRMLRELERAIAGGDLPVMWWLRCKARLMWSWSKRLIRSGPSPQFAPPTHTSRPFA
jgi:hypothetical protein